jgi:hypothetical protein
MITQPADGFIKWQPIDAHYTDPNDLRAAMFDQSARTVGGSVAEFRINHSNSDPASSSKDLT